MSSPTIADFKTEHLKEGYLGKVDQNLREIVTLFNDETEWAITYGSCEGHSTIHKEGYIAMIVKEGEINRLIHILRLVKQSYPHTPMRLGINWDPDQSDSLSPTEVPEGWISIKLKFFTLSLPGFVEVLKNAIARYK